mmetsp:Transcript_1783/g.4762  ORF Transcript_1783/g.4762 Transcript_1783/m.4762 type:complete len:255 (-) Transcript_1783:390-1154(-)
MRQVQRAHAVPDSASDVRSSDACGLHVAKATPGARLGAVERADARRHVVRLAREEQVHIDVRLRVRARLTRFSLLLEVVGGQEHRHPRTDDARAVVVKSDHAVLVGVGVFGERLLDDLEQGLLLLLAVDDHLAPEEPMTRMLRVGLGQVEELAVRGVALKVIDEEVQIILVVPIVEAETQLPVDLLQRSSSILQHGNRLHRLGDHAALERHDGGRVHHLRHPVVDHTDQRRLLLSRKWRRRGYQKSARALQTRN